MPVFSASSSKDIGSSDSLIMTCLVRFTFTYDSQHSLTLMFYSFLQKRYRKNLITIALKAHILFHEPPRWPVPKFIINTHLKPIQANP